jgi:hypothetical protein
MKNKFQNITRVVSAAMLVSLLAIAPQQIMAKGAPVKEKKKGKVTVFADGWQKLKPVEGEHQIGNFTCISLKGEPKQAANKKWTSAWGNWTVNGTDGAAKRGVIMVPGKVVNDDWLVSEEIDLENCKKPLLQIDGYSKYGTDKGNDLKVLISEDYNGDVEAAHWDELWMESFHKENQAVEREISLKKYQGRKVVIAFRSIHSGTSLKNLTRTTFLSKVEVKAVKK